MASLGSLIVSVGAEISGFTDAMGTVSDKLGKLSDDAEKSFRGFDHLGDQLTGFGTTLSAAITLPLLAAGGAAVKFAGDFDSEMRKVTSLIEDVTEKDFKSLSGQVLELSKSMGVDAVKSADALYQALSSGVPQDNAIDFLKIATVAAIAGVTDTRVAVDGLTTVLQAFNLNASETKKVSDSMFEAVKIGKLEFPELAASIGIAAGTAHALGISYNELLAAGATLTNTTGQKIPEAMTMLQSAMKALINPTADMEKLLDKMGTTGEKLVREKGLEGGLKAIADAAGGNVTVLTSLFGRVEGLRATLGLTGDNAERAARDLEQFSHASDGVGAAASAAAEINKGFARQLETFTTEIKAVAIELGTALLPVVESAFHSMKPLIDLVEDGVKKFAGLPDPLRNTALGMAAIAAGVGPALIVLGSMISAFGKLATAIELVNTALTSKGLVAVVTGFGAATVGVAVGAAAAGAAIGYLGNKALDASIAQENANAKWLKGVDASSALSHTVNDTGTKFDSAGDSILSFVKKLDSHADSSKKAGTSTADLAASHAVLEKALKGAEENLSAVEKAVKLGVGTEEDAAKARMKVVAATQALHPELKSIFAETDSWNSVLKISNDLAGEQGEALLKAAPTISAHTALLESQAASLQARAGLWKLDMQGIQDQGAALTASDDVLSGNIVNMKEFDSVQKMVQAGFKEQLKDIQQATLAEGPLHNAHVLGIADLGELKKRVTEANTAYNDLAKQGFGSNIQQMEAHARVLQRDIDLVIQAGGDSTKLRIELDQTTSAIQRQATGFSDLYKSLQQVIGSDVSRTFNDLIFDVGKLGADFKKLGEDIVSTVGDRILKQALQPLEDKLSKIITLGVDALAKVAGIGVNSIPTPGVGGLPTGVYQPGISDIPKLPGLGGLGGDPGGLPGVGGMPGVDLAGGGAGGATGAIGQALGASIAPIMGIVTGAISAVTGVISVFQNMHQETSLNAIEANTRVGALYTLAAQQWIQGMAQFMGNSIFPELKGILDWQGYIVNAITALGTVNMSALPAQIATALTPLFKPDTASPQQFKIYLDGRELLQSYVTALSESGTVAPAT